MIEEQNDAVMMQNIMKKLDQLVEEMERSTAKSDKIKMNVILITYNQEKYIRTTLQSILDQKTNFRFNVLVADDHSEDKTLQIIQEMEKQTEIPFVYLDCSHNLGIMKNYRRSFAACDAEYVAVMEGDDIWTDPYRLQKHKDFLDAHPECSMSFNRFVVKDFKKGTANTQPVINYNILETYRLFSAADLAYDNFIGNFSTCVYKNAYLERLPHQLYDVHAYDWLTNILIARMGCVGCLLQPMSIYRIHSGGIWSQKKQQEKIQEVIDVIKVYDMLTDREYTEAFAAHRQRLENQLRKIKTTSDKAEKEQSDEMPVGRQRSVKRIIKKILIRCRGCCMRFLDFMPPVVTALLKWLVPPVLVQKITNMREV